MKTKITRKAMAYGSFGILPAQQTPVINVWIAAIDEHFIGGFATRAEARRAIADHKQAVAYHEAAPCD